MSTLISLKDASDPLNWMNKLISAHQGNIQSAAGQLIREFKNLDHGVAMLTMKTLLTSNALVGRQVIERALVDGLASIIWSPDIEAFIYELADDPEWDVRESAQLALKSALETNFDLTIKVIRKWARDSNPNIRRAAMVACRPNPHETQDHVECMLDVVESLTSDSAAYVKKNVPYVLRFYRRYPEQILPRLLRLANQKNLIVKSNVAKACEGTLAKTHPNDVLEILRVLAAENNNSVQQLILKALSRIGKEHPKLLNNTLTAWKKDKTLRELASKALRSGENA